MITKEQFLLRQPSFPETVPSDPFYYQTACDLLKAATEARTPFSEALLGRAALCLTGYYQDIVSDAGLWRGFINECRRLYDYTVPFFETGEDYVDYELNRADVTFLTWYALAMNDDRLRALSPLDGEVARLADIWYRILEERYDDAPMPEGYNMAHELEFHDPEDQQQIFRLGHWLFLHSYLLTPAYSMTLASILAEPELQGKEADHTLLASRLEQSMTQDPTGPLALYLPEWLYLTISDRMPPEPKKGASATPAPPHKYYTLFTQATGGRDIAYFKTYDELNTFFIRALGWQEGERHLDQLSAASDFVLMVNREKGMLLARDVARCIADPANPLYDRTYASTHAFDLLTVRGLCPGDLLRRILAEGWLPDATFPDTQTQELVRRNADFIARCYLQLYYRGD